MAEPNIPSRLFVVPAGGYGTRLYPLTANQAKPSLPMSFEGGNVTRMIDIPLSCIQRLGGKALVSVRFQAESLRFIERYANITRIVEDDPQTTIDTLMQQRNMLDQASEVWIVPGDADVSLDQLESMSSRLSTSGANAVVLGTNHRDDHYVWPIDNNGRLTAPDQRDRVAADLGVHVVQAAWLADILSRLDPAESHNIWGHVYNYLNPQGDILIHVPDYDRRSIDLGTPHAYAAKVRALTSRHADERGNILFPGADVQSGSMNVVALPNSYGSVRLADAILPENVIVSDTNQALNLVIR